MIVRAIEDGNISTEYIPFNYSELVKLTKNILKIYQPLESKLSTYRSRYYRLRDSRPIGGWRREYENYNCYAYAIDLSRWINPGDYSDSIYRPGMRVSEVADMTVRDLERMGYIAYTSYRLGESIYNRARLIALRVCDDDYHFMKDVGNERNWEHKPGPSQLLSWNYVDPYYTVWTNEAVYKGETYSPTLYYNSDIIYIYYWPKGTGPSPALLKNRKIK